MSSKTQDLKSTRLGAGILLTLISFMLVGCGQSRYTLSDGSENNRSGWEWAPPARLASGNSGSTGAVIVSPIQSDSGYARYEPGFAPEFDRRDRLLNIRENDPYAGYLGFPEHSRPSIDDYRSLYISPSPNRYLYSSDYGPGIRNNYSNRRRTYRSRN